MNESLNESSTEPLLHTALMQFIFPFSIKKGDSKQLIQQLQDDGFTRFFWITKNWKLPIMEKVTVFPMNEWSAPIYRLPHTSFFRAGRMPTRFAVFPE